MFMGPTPPVIGPAGLWVRMPRAMWSLSQLAVMSTMLNTMTEDVEAAFRRRTLTEQERDNLVAALRSGMAQMTAPVVRIMAGEALRHAPLAEIIKSTQPARPAVDVRIM